MGGRERRKVMKERDGTREGRQYGRGDDGKNSIIDEKRGTKLPSDPRILPQRTQNSSLKSYAGHPRSLFVIS